MSAHQVRSPTNRARKVSNRKISKLHLTVGPTNAYSRCATAQPDTSGRLHGPLNRTGTGEKPLRIYASLHRGGQVGHIRSAQKKDSSPGRETSYIPPSAKGSQRSAVTSMVQPIAVRSAHPGDSLKTPREKLYRVAGVDDDRRPERAHTIFHTSFSCWHPASAWRASHHL